MKAAVLTLPWAWLAAFLLLPLGLLFGVSLATPAEGIPPFAWALDPAAYAGLLDPDYRAAFGQSIKLASAASALTLLVGYPLALAVADAPARWRGTLLTLLILPFWTGFLLRLTALIGLMRDDGWLDQALGAVRLPPAHLLYTPAAAILGIAYCYLPFMVLPLYARLSARDRALEDAAADLGAPPWRVLLTVTLPLSVPGVVAGLLLVFIPAMGEYVIPELLGGPDVEPVGRVLWSEFFANRDWPTAAALAMVLMAALVVPAALWQWRQGARA